MVKFGQKIAKLVILNIKHSTSQKVLCLLAILHSCLLLVPSQASVF